jgi:hypothetical protein
MNLLLPIQAIIGVIIGILVINGFAQLVVNFLIKEKQHHEC